ncbi:50S ribosomal protein L29 [Marinilabilia salmonicolor]|jgi:large subunit ribosomal protein L29|uniref:Large ribosomal subunit protein uL29 n=1 Tax=Marinilabilia salmonicolor TaxID=989 RepID=A0A2T0XTD5_9BACT|nr:50S ribosomal protein L29 [Marinilabilia salmonicolor]PRZ02209.1 large subunit ribosomal protein L29 [Marinilabilia salmonicolor]RCW36164.1 large subunit ribosomal protein L29 [Marinilabilia salmonicolor]
MKSSEIKEMAPHEIEERIDALSQELVRMKLNHTISPLENPMKIKHTRQDIARMKTILRQKQLNEKS